MTTPIHSDGFGLAVVAEFDSVSKAGVPRHRVPSPAVKPKGMRTSDTGLATLSGHDQDVLEHWLSINRLAALNLLTLATRETSPTSFANVVT